MSTLSNIPFCSIVPTTKQRLFVERPELEVFFGGAAGGGKSAALLMAALLYVDRPGYAALIIRKDLPRLSLPGGLISRSHEWLANSDAKWNQARKQWTFPVEVGTAATITFGFLARPLDKFRYSSSEYQYIAFDELTDFAAEDYLFLFSRLRKIKTLDVPLRMRSASNPGGVGHLWVKQRFVEEETGFGVQGSANEGQRSEVGDQHGANLLTSDLYRLTSHLPARNPEPRPLNPPPPGVFCKQGRIYIPSRIADNPFLDEAEYRQSLSHLPAVDRERLMHGDWDVQEHNKFKAQWLRYYVEHGEQLELLQPDGRAIATVPASSCWRFVTIDPAGTSAEQVKETSGHAPCWSVLQVWDRPRNELARFLVLRHQVRERLGFEGLCGAIEKLHAQWRPERFWVEGEKLGHALVDVLKHKLPIECIATGNKDKAIRAGPLILKMERGEVFLPLMNTTWRPGFEAELLAWTGHPRQAADQIDAAAYAALVAGNAAGGAIRLLRGVAAS